MTLKKTLAGLALGFGLISSSLEARADPINSVTLNPVTNAANITWLWTTQNLVQASAGLGGYISGNTNDWIEQGSNATLTATASNGYTFANWGGTPVSGNATNSSPITFSANDTYTNILANFAPNMYAITVNNGGYGTASPGSTNLPYGSSFTTAINPTTNAISPGRRAVLKGVNVTGHNYTQP